MVHVQFVEFLWHPRQRRSCFCASSPRRTSNTDWTGFCSDHFLKEASPSSLSLLDTTLCKHVIVNYMTVSILPKKQLKYMDGEDGREPFPGCRKAHLLSGPLALRALHSRFLEIIESEKCTSLIQSTWFTVGGAWLYFNFVDVLRIDCSSPAPTSFSKKFLSAPKLLETLPAVPFAITPRGPLISWT